MNRPLHLLQVVTRRQLRGAEVFAGDLSTALAARGHRVVLVGLYPPGEPALAPPGLPVADLGRRKPRLPLDPRLAWALAREIRRRRPDLLQANGSDTLKYSLAARRLSGLPVPVVYRSISIGSHWLRGPLHRRWLRALLRSVDHVVAVSRRSREDLLAVHGLPPDGVTVIPRAIALPDPTSAATAADAALRLRALAGFPAHCPLVVHVGSLTAEKNHALLLDAVALLGRTLPELRLVGFGAGPLAGELAARAAEPGLAGRVWFGGARPDAPDLAAGADVLALTSDVEGMPGVVLEAGARGLPVVATDVGGVSEVVEHGRTGLLVPPRDAAAFAAALEALLGDPERRRALGTALQQRIAAEFTLPPVTDRYEALYRRLVAEAADG